jgi:2-polyprenyl-6-methoxyphenol hydroxylase-like FAD-dependent oxidoreductase
MIILDELKKYPCVEVCFGKRCVGIQDDPSAGPVRVMTVSRRLDQPELFIDADYVLATDGANSAVRRLLCIPFEGFTYPGWKMIGTDVLYDFVKEEGFTPLNFIVHPEVGRCVCAEAVMADICSIGLS